MNREPGFISPDDGPSSSPRGAAKALPVQSEPEAGPEAYQEPGLRRRVLTLVLLSATALILFLCFQILRPFISVFAWSVALSVISFPIYRKIRARVKGPNIAAALAVGILAIGIMVPLGFTLRQIAKEGIAAIEVLSAKVENTGWEEMLNASSTRTREVLVWLNQNLNVRDAMTQFAAQARDKSLSILTFSVWSAVELLLVLFTCFFLYRDRRLFIDAVRDLIPLAKSEIDELFLRVEQTIHATLYGTVVVAVVQGSLGGLIFWVLDLPAPVLWGTVMAFLALIPYAGAFVVWAPAAIYLAAEGQWPSALILTFWGSVVIALIDNLLYPILVGKELRFHTLPIFFFILGGVLFFGGAGIVLGPLTLSVADAMREVWRRRLSRRAPLPH